MKVDFFERCQKQYFIAFERFDYLEVSNSFNFGTSFYSKFSFDYRRYISFGKTKSTYSGKSFLSFKSFWYSAIL
jgi:hypothetical protein